jgi:hypothetical protein
MRVATVILLLLAALLLVCAAFGVLPAKVDVPAPAQRQLRQRALSRAHRRRQRRRAQLPPNCFVADEGLATEPHARACSLVSEVDAGLPPGLRASDGLRSLYEAQRRYAVALSRERRASVHSAEPLVTVLHDLLGPEAVTSLRRQVAQRTRHDDYSGFEESPSSYVNDGDVPLALRKVFTERLQRLFDWPADRVEIMYKHYPDVLHSTHRLHVDGGGGEPANAEFCNRRFNHVATSLLIYLDTPHGGEVYFPDLDLAIAPREGSALMFHSFDIR